MNYILKDGEKSVLVHRRGRNIGSGYMHRIVASIAIVHDEKKVYRGHTPYRIASTSTYASHYKSGLSHKDFAAYNVECQKLQIIVDNINNLSNRRQQK